ncbi:MAG TPA: type II toxin-antitoxin system VapC family toxin [Candidatus Saccharimonadales bacterium]|nr:type II toxin-antitoxin system VapC family toxin [Candidatus Saccharimonadales bacterium]
MIAGVVVDTDVVSFLYKHDTRATAYRGHLDGKLLLVSFMAIAELDRWTLERNWGEKRKQDLETFMQRFTIIEVSRDLCRKWAEATHSARRAGRPIETADAWMAATALLYEVPLITHNGRHYAGVSGLQVITEAP